MNIRKALENFYRFLIGNGESGHTTLLEKIAKNEDVYVLVYNEEQKEMFDKDIYSKLINFQKIKYASGLERKPILLDNGVLMDIIRQSMIEIDTKESQVIDHALTIQEISKIINNIEKRYPEKYQNCASYNYVDDLKIFNK